MLATGDAAGTVGIWDLATGRAVRTFWGFASRVTSLVFSADGDVLHATASADSGERLLWSWPVAGGDANARLTVDSELPERSPFRAAVYDPEHRRLAWAAGDEVSYVSLDEPSSAVSLEGPTEEVTAVALSHDGGLIAAGSLDRRLVLWNGDSHEIVDVLLGNGQQIRSLAFSDDGRWLASGGADRSLRVWELASGVAHAVFGRPLLAGDDLWDLEVSATRRRQKIGSVGLRDGYDFLVVDLKLGNKLDEPTLFYGTGLAIDMAGDSAEVVGTGNKVIRETFRYVRIHVDARETLEESFIFVIPEDARDMELRLLDMAPIPIR